MIESNETRSRLLRITALANEYCNLLQQTFDYDKLEFVEQLTSLLPRIYCEFCSLDLRRDTLREPEREEEEETDAIPDPDALIDLAEEEEEFFQSYVDEDFYESVRRHAEMLFGPEDVFLETFEEDMKYSDTPIAASISECLADIFQPLYNFISVVKDTEGASLEGAYRECRANFAGYWSQTLCNVMRPLNNIRFNNNL